MSNTNLQLKRKLTLPLVTFYGIGTILGAGIYVLVGKVAGYAGMYTPIAFLLALVLATFSALSYAEFSARFPLSAGEAVYIFKGLNCRLLSVFIGICICFASATSVATLLLGVVGYLKVLIEVSDLLVIVSLTLLMGLIVSWGIGESVLIATIMTLIGMAGLLLIIWVARDNLNQLPVRLHEMVPTFRLAIWEGILLGSFIAFYAFLGFEDIVNVAEEVRNPQRNLPLAIILALVITTLFYMAISTVCVLSLPTARLAQTDAPLAMLYSNITGRPPLTITLISLTSILNGALIQIIKTSRILYGMSRQGWLPSWLGRVNSRTHTPLYATLFAISSILLFALYLPLLDLVKLSSFITLFVFALINFSLWRLKVHQPAVTDVFSIPCWVPVVGFFTSSSFALYQLFYVLSNQ
ncbi:MAG: amino acid permease [Methyloprofundus sp.]|nr:amino acid permease [Methyloprofundus sp.]